MEHPSVEGFWWFVQERERVRLCKQAGQAPPWTDDPTLQRYHFCNIRRADDFGTQWYVQQVAASVLGGRAKGRIFNESWAVDLVWSTIVYRLVNNVEWFDAFGHVPTYEEWKRVKRPMTKRILAMKRKPYSLAYRVLMGGIEKGGSRAERLVDILNDLEQSIVELAASVAGAHTLERAWQIVQRTHGVGPFTALQIVRDLMLVDFLPSEWENDFTYLGPGAQLGLELLGFSPKYHLMYGVTHGLRDEQPVEIQPPLVLGDIEHCLCEYAKHVKFRDGRGRRRRYQPHVQDMAIHG